MIIVNKIIVLNIIDFCQKCARVSDSSMLEFSGASPIACFLHTGEVVEWPVVIKSKPLDSETATMINKMAQACGLELAVQYERHKLDTGFR